MRGFTRSDAQILIYNFETKSSVDALEETVLPYLDLTICIEGEMHYFYNGNYIRLFSGDAILFPKGSTRKRLYSDKPCRYASFNITFSKKAECEIEGYIPKCVNPDIIYLLESVKKDFSSISSKKREKCLCAFFYIYCGLCESVTDIENPHVKAIKQFILDNLQSKLSLESIASHVHLAPQYICSVFKKQTGYTIMNFVKKQRIDLAKRLIITSGEPINKIAERCGFDDLCYFSHAFKKATGISAKQYRAGKRQ